MVQHTTIYKTDKIAIKSVSSRETASWCKKNEFEKRWVILSTVGNSNISIKNIIEKLLEQKVVK